jgi:predicted dienelactone hydrolase
MSKVALIFFFFLMFVSFKESEQLQAQKAYDPLEVVREKSEKNETIDLTVEDTKRKREIPIRVYLPLQQTAAPVILFSHGLGGSKEGGAYLGKHWASRGYVGVFLQHPGSDTSVWKDQPPGQKMSALREAANGENFLLRVQDVPTVLDQLERWNQAESHRLAGRLDLKKVGMSGHSFGAVTTQAVSGQKPRLMQHSFTDMRIKAALALSPSVPSHAKDPSRFFGQVQIPWMLMTGTQDISPIGDTDVESRLAVYPALPAGGKYELVLYEATHSAFSDRGRFGEKGKRNPNHHRVILALSTAFWDSWLKKDSKAKEWLEGEGARSVLEKEDRWQYK